MSKLARNDVLHGYLQILLSEKKKYIKIHNGRWRPYWILKKVTTFQKSVSTKVVPIDLRNSNPVSVAIPLKCIRTYRAGPGLYPLSQTIRNDTFVLDSSPNFAPHVYTFLIWVLFFFFIPQQSMKGISVSLYVWLVCLFVCLLFSFLLL